VNYPGKDWRPKTKGKNTKELKRRSSPHPSKYFVRTILLNFLNTLANAEIFVSIKGLSIRQWEICSKTCFKKMDMNKIINTIGCYWMIKNKKYNKHSN
jgi:hypothetical protein